MVSKSGHENLLWFVWAEPPPSPRQGRRLRPGKPKEVLMSERFAHHRLDVYELALELAVSAKGISEQIPRGYRSLSDQLIRSGSGVVLLIAEGANRFSSAQKRQRFVEARGE